jgi:copper resistance protein D
VTGFLDVLLRGLILCGQALAVGGVFFAVVVLRPAVGGDAAWSGRERRTLSLVAAGAALIVVAQALSALIQLVTLRDELGWPIQAAFATSFYQVSAVKMLVAIALITAALSLRRRPWPGGSAVLIGLCVLLPLVGAGTSHAAARLEHRGVLFGLDALHQFATAVWVGGLFNLVAAAARDGDRPWPEALLRRFSALSLGAVIALTASGLGLAFYYVESPQAMIGTGYGLMVMTKVAMLAALAVFGAMNFFAVRRFAALAAVSRVRMRRFVEVELGLGFIVFFAAASLTSLPPAVDVVADRATIAEVGHRFAPHWPRFSSPPIEALPVGDREAPRTDEDRAWSEFNHHWSGIFVLAMGILALLNRLGAGWARNWPLIFLGMAAFMLLRNDPGSWPLGPETFWEGMAHVEVVQHRIFVLLVTIFGIFEWAVRSGRLRSPRAALAFPLLCVIGGGLLLTHSHASLNLKAEYLLEVTHAPLGVLALAIGWDRWLELRLPPPGNKPAGRLLSCGLIAIGLLLIFYRES